MLHERGVNTDDIEHVEGGKTFFWRGHYEYDLNTAHTDDTQLNVFGDFEPKLSEESKAADVLFLANIQPDLQREVREQCTGARLAGPRLDEPLDRDREGLARADDRRRRPDLHERRRAARCSPSEPNLVRAARAVMEMGPRV